MDSLLHHANGNGRSVFVSAVTREGFSDLLARIDVLMPVEPLVRVRLSLPVSDGRSHAAIYATGRVLVSGSRVNTS